jgi:hypothetical protein
LEVDSNLSVHEHPNLNVVITSPTASAPIICSAAYSNTSVPNTPLSSSHEHFIDVNLNHANRNKTTFSNTDRLMGTESEGNSQGQYSTSASNAQPDSITCVAPSSVSVSNSESMSCANSSPGSIPFYHASKALSDLLMRLYPSPMDDPKIVAYLSQSSSLGTPIASNTDGSNKSVNYDSVTVHSNASTDSSAQDLSNRSFCLFGSDVVHNNCNNNNLNTDINVSNKLNTTNNDPAALPYCSTVVPSAVFSEVSARNLSKRIRLHPNSNLFKKSPKMSTLTSSTSCTSSSSSSSSLLSTSCASTEDAFHNEKASDNVNEIVSDFSVISSHTHTPFGSKKAHFDAFDTLSSTFIGSKVRFAIVPENGYGHTSTNTNINNADSNTYKPMNYQGHANLNQNGHDIAKVDNIDHGSDDSSASNVSTCNLSVGESTVSAENQANCHDTDAENTHREIMKELHSQLNSKRFDNTPTKKHSSVNGILSFVSPPSQKFMSLISPSSDTAPSTPYNTAAPAQHQHVLQQGFDKKMGSAAASIGGNINDLKAFDDADGVNNNKNISPLNVFDLMQNKKRRRPCGDAEYDSDDIDKK